MGMLLLVLLFNLVVSFFNARNVGRVWAESKALGASITDVFATFGSAGHYILPAVLAVAVCVIGHFKAAHQAKASTAI